MAKYLIIYRNLDQYHLDEADVKRTTVAVSVWKRRSKNSFTWGLSNPMFRDEAKELNRLTEELNEKKANFEARLEGTQPLP
jgi:hypothetical protein